MSFISASDILKCVQIGYQLYQKFYVRSNQADARYLEFLKDVRQLSSHLERLAKVFERAGGDQPDGTSSQLQIIKARHAQSREIIGDFASTLEECRKLLVENQAVAKNTVVCTARWYIRGSDSRSQSLKAKVLFHCTKISFIVEPLELELLQKISQDVLILQQQIRALSQRIEGSSVGSELPPVPADLAARYEEAALNDRPFDSSEAYPLRDTVNALLFNFSQSTVNASSYQHPSMEQFNALLKARWTLDKVLQNPQYKRLGPCLTRSVVSSVKDKIEFEYNRFEDGWVTVELNGIDNLEEDCFGVWFEENPKGLSPSATEEDFGESKIIDLPLQTGQDQAEQSILVFRQSDTEYRLLRKTLGEAGLKQVLNTHTFACVPLYAVPGTSQSLNTISFCHNSINRPEVLDMQTQDDVMVLQQAFTNYRVMNNCASIEWSLSRQKLHHKALKGSGRSGIQIWHPQTLERADSADNTLGTDVAVTENSSSRRASTFADDLVGRLQNRPGSLISVAQGSSNTAVDGVIASMRPKVPALIIFTQLPTKHGDAYSFVYIPMNMGFHINKYRCGCAASSSNCHDIILEMNPGKRNKFTAKIHRALSSRHEPSLQDWNLFLFADPKPKAYNDLETIDDAVELRLRFDSVQERKLFQIWLCRTLELMKQSTDDFNKVRSQMRVLEHRLHTTGNRPPGSRSDSIASQIGPLLSPTIPPQPRSHRASSASSGSATLSGRGVSPANVSAAGSFTPPPAHALSPQPERLNHQTSHSTLGSASLASIDPPPHTSPFRVRVASAAGPSTPPPPPDKSILRRASSKTIVASPTTGDMDRPVFHFPGSRAAPGLSRIADEDEEEADYGHKSYEPGYLQPQSSLHGKQVGRMRADSGASLSPLSGSPETYSAMKAAAAAAANNRTMYAAGSPRAARNMFIEDPDEVAVADGYAPSAARVGQHNSNVMPQANRVQTWIKLMPDQSELSRALHKQHSLEGEDNALRIMGSRHVS